MNELHVGKASHIASLIVRSMQDTLTDEGKKELEAWLQEGGDNYSLFEELMDEEKLVEALDELHTLNPDAAYERLSQKLHFTEPGGKRISIKFWLYMVAAILVMAVVGIAYLSLNTKQVPPFSTQVVAQKKPAGTGADYRKAMLQLANGSTIVLSEMSNGIIAREGNVVIEKKSNGELAFRLEGNAPGETIYNTLYTPRGRGGEYQVTLTDGSKVWLNASSSLRFPIHFNKNDRQVIMKGEAYFEVASLPLPSSSGGGKRPFIVLVNNMQVQAVGTSFNISAYQEDQNTQTTVVEGLVKINQSNQERLLHPGQKLEMRNNSMILSNADIKEALAWKNDQFVFRNTSLQMVMNELARWYDMDIEYEQPVPSLHFSGEIPRESSLDKVLQMLEYTGGVKFTVTGRTIKVLAG